MLESRRGLALLGVLLVASLLAGLLPRLASASIPRGVPTAPATVFAVLFDNAHAETAGNADWIISTSQPDPLVEDPSPQVETDWTGGMSAWGVALQRTGRYSLKTNTSPITYGNGSNPLDLSHFDALVLPEPNTLFTTAEKTAIMSFVSNGGGIFMLANHNGSDRNNDGWDSLEIFNDLMNNSGAGSDPFGIQFDVLDINSENPSNDTPNPDPLLQGPFGTANSSIIRAGTTETINPAHNPNARGVIYRNSFPNTGNTGIFVARGTYGSGRVVAVGDSSAGDDGTCAPGNTCFDGWMDPNGDNSILFPNATEWLVGGGTASTTTPTNTATNTPTPTRTATPVPGATNTTTSTPAPPTPTGTPAAGVSHIVVSQIYGAGGNSGASWRNDFIELFNPTSAPLVMSNWSVQYASATGSSWNAPTTINGTIPAGGYYLVQESSSGSNGTPLPSPDATGTLNMSTTTGKVALVNNTTPLTCGSAGNSCLPNPNIIDYVGYGGSASDFEGSGPTLAPGATTSVTRLNGGCTDTDDNASDFATGNPVTPRNSAWALHPCAAPTAIPTATPTATYTATYTPTPTLTRTATSTSTYTPTATPAVQGVLVGHVLWQGRPPQPSALQQLPVTLTLKAGSVEVNYPEQSTDASGYFTVSVSSLPNGGYNWRVKSPKFLANAGVLTLSGAPRADLEIGLMQSGDANNDNSVSAADFSILKSTFGKTLGDPGYDDRADFTGDSAVSAADFGVLKSNFGLGGAPPIGP